MPEFRPEFVAAPIGAVTSSGVCRVCGTHLDVVKVGPRDTAIRDRSGSTIGGTPTVTRSGGTVVDAITALRGTILDRTVPLHVRCAAATAYTTLLIDMTGGVHHGEHVHILKPLQ